jgi:hypothetical protein
MHSRMQHTKGISVDLSRRDGPMALKSTICLFSGIISPGFMYMNSVYVDRKLSVPLFMKRQWN